jgi:hypothetical protein
MLRGDGTKLVRIGPSVETFWDLIHEFGSPEENIPSPRWLGRSA